MPSQYSINNDRPDLTNSMIRIVISGFTFLLALVLLGMWGCPKYAVYNQKMQGEAEYSQAVYNTRVKTLEAMAAESAAVHLAAQDTIRAHGVALSNQIIGASLEHNQAYLEWLYIDGLKENKNAQIIYLPTEAGLPILEAGRLGLPSTPVTPPADVKKK
jgi:hypothetical protein